MTVLWCRSGHSTALTTTETGRRGRRHARFARRHEIGIALTDTALELDEDEGERRVADGGSRRARLQRARRIKDRRPVRVALAVVGVVAIGFVVAAIFVVSQKEVNQILIPAAESPDIDLRADLTIRSINAQTGEVGVRLVLADPNGRRTEAGLVTDSFSIQVNDVGGQTTYLFPEGQPIRAIDYSVALNDGSVFGYPFDNYRAGLLVFGFDGTEVTEGGDLAMETTAASSQLDFDITAESDDCFESTCVTLDIDRPMSTIGYTLWAIVLVWGLGLVGFAVLAVTIRRGLEIPLWSYGYQVGVLFALPLLRSSLPSSPPSGGFVDFVAFYWATAVVGTTLLGLVGLWIREARRPPLA